ncbi:MAG: carboxyl-terminal processing protease, partial [Polaribacter sp.]
MKITKKISITLITFLLLFTSVNANNDIKKADPEKDKILIYVLKNILTRGHFVVKDMNDDFSEQVFISFIEGLDPSKRYFTQKDLKEFSKFKYEIDNQLLEDDVSFYNLVYRSFTKKIKNAKSYYGEILAQPFDFKRKETIDIDYDKVQFAENENELISYWRKQLKLNVLSRIQDKLEKQE